jgi:hypothetical protein
VKANQALNRSSHGRARAPPDKTEERESRERGQQRGRLVRREKASLADQQGRVTHGVKRVGDSDRDRVDGADVHGDEQVERDGQAIELGVEEIEKRQVVSGEGTVRPCPRIRLLKDVPPFHFVHAVLRADRHSANEALCLLAVFMLSHVTHYGKETLGRRCRLPRSFV